MAQNVTVAGASFSDVPSVSLPKTGGGTASFTDVSDTTATAADVAAGSYFYTAAGVRTEGTNSGGSLVIRDEPDSHGGTVRHITAGDVVQGTVNITSNGTFDVAAYADANVSVSGGPSLGALSSTAPWKSASTPTAAQESMFWEPWSLRSIYVGASPVISGELSQSGFSTGGTMLAGGATIKFFASELTGAWLVTFDQNWSIDSITAYSDLDITWDSQTYLVTMVVPELEMNEHLLVGFLQN